jgi:hypothetical protein
VQIVGRVGVSGENLGMWENVVLRIHDLLIIVQ